MNTQPIKIVLPKPNYTWISSLSALLKSFQFLNSLQIPESNSCFAGDVFDIKAINNSAIEYFIATVVTNSAAKNSFQKLIIRIFPIQSETDKL